MALHLTLYLICLISLFGRVANMYRNYSLEMNRVCPLNFKIPELTVGKENHSSVIIRDGDYFKKWSGQNAFDCKFVVRASFGLSLIGVIQNMYLRKNETTGDCIDFIQFGFKHSLGLGYVINLDINPDKWEDRRLCGELGGREREDMESLHDYSVKNKKGIIYVKIHVERKPVPVNTTLNLQIVFTSYKECRNNEGSYRMCGDSMCVHKNYIGDSIINCPSCNDEDSCAPSQIEAGDAELNTKVTVTAVTSIFLSFFLFLGCMMLCRYILLFRQWHQPPPVTTVEMTPPPPDDTVLQPSAPPNTVDKDLPPAYETLFPDR